MCPSDFDQAIFDSVTPSDLGPVFTEYKNNPGGAIKRLMAERTGDARAVVERSDIGTIDLIYGNSKGGLAHIAMKHPEIIGMLPSLLRNGRLVKKPGAKKVFLISERNPADVVVVALDWYGAAKTWVVTSYLDERGVFTGSTKRIDTDALDSAWVEVLYAGQWTRKILGHDMQSVNIFDSATRLGALERLKLVKRLLGLRTEADGLGVGGAAAMRKLKIAKEMIEIRQKLGLGAPQPALTPDPAPVAAPAPASPPEQSENEHVKTLRNISKGLHDGDGLDGMFGLIQEAVNSLEEDGALDAEAERVANEAITHWAEVEERLNG